MKKLLSACSDFVFKLLFSTDGNIGLLAAFLSATLNLPLDEFEELTILDPHLPRMYEGDKLGILDVKVRTKHGTVIDIEIQIVVLPSLPGRIVYYSAKMLTEQIVSGDHYNKLKRVISIVIAADNIIPNDNKYHHRFRMRDENGVEFTDLIEVNTLELKKLPAIGDDSDLWAWLKFLSAQTEEELAMVETRSPQLKQAVAKLKEYSADEQIRAEAEAREKALRLYYSSISESEEIGKVAGRVEERANLTAQLIGLGVSPDIIAEAIKKLDEQNS